MDLEAGFLPRAQRFARTQLERLVREALDAGWRVRWFEPDAEVPRERGEPQAPRVLNVFVDSPGRFFRA